MCSDSVKFPVKSKVGSCFYKVCREDQEWVLLLQNFVEKSKDGFHAPKKYAGAAYGWVLILLKLHRRVRMDSVPEKFT